VVALGLVGLAALLGAWILFRRRRQAYTAPPENTLFDRHDEPQEVTKQPGFELRQRKEQHYDPPPSKPQGQYNYQPPAMELESQPYTLELA
jgi:LPXTG-motif cell wall-anchored protein